jgi:hypothetical protein
MGTPVAAVVVINELELTVERVERSHGAVIYARTAVHDHQWVTAPNYVHI